MLNPAPLPAPDPATGLSPLQSVDQAAAILNVSRATVIRAADDGSLEESRIGSRRLFTCEAIRKYIEQATADAAKRNEERRRKAASRAAKRAKGINRK